MQKAGEDASFCYLRPPKSVSKQFALNNVITSIFLIAEISKTLQG